MDQRPFDSEFDRWLAASLTSRPAPEPIAGLAQRVLSQVAERPLALDDARRLRRQWYWLRVANIAAALALVGTVLFVAPGAWQSYQAGVQTWSEVRDASNATASTAGESSNSATNSNELLWVTSASLLAVVIGLAVSETLTSGGSLRYRPFTLSYR